jgi:hypothetical protein
MPDILVYVPIHRLWGRALQSILRLEWDGRLDIVFAKGDDAPPEADKQARFEAVTAKYNHGRDALLAGSYAAMLTVEDDMIVPSDALRRLWATDADIAYGLYCWRNSNWHKWSAYTELGERHGVSLSDDREAASAAWGTVVDVAGIGNGCTLIRRHVLERLAFRKTPYACCDWGLALDAQAAGYRQACDLGVVCGHMTNTRESTRQFPAVTGTTGEPRIIWPDPDLEGTGRLYRLEYL